MKSLIETKSSPSNKIGITIMVASLNSSQRPKLLIAVDTATLDYWTYEISCHKHKDIYRDKIGGMRYWQSVKEN